MMQFERDYGSSLNIKNILMYIVLILAAIIFLVLKKIVLSIIFGGFVVFLLIMYKKIPKNIRIDTEFIEYGKEKVFWTSIEKVEFTTTSIRDSSDTIVRIESSQTKHSIHTNLYKNSKDLRDTIESICKEKNIYYIVRDRGLY